MSSCSSCTPASQQYTQQLLKQVTEPPKFNPAAPPKDNPAQLELNTTGALGRALNITA